MESADIETDNNNSKKSFESNSPGSIEKLKDFNSDPSNNSNNLLIGEGVFYKGETVQYEREQNEHDERKEFEINSLEGVQCTLFQERIERINKSPGECYDFGRPAWTFDMGIDAGLFYPMKEFRAKSPNEVYNSRIENEKSLEGLRASLWGRVSRENTPFYFKAGAAYSRITERLNLEYSYTRYDTTQGIISITESQNGDTLTIIKGNIVTETNVVKKLKKHYYFHSIDLPLAIGYEVEVNKFRIGIEAGVELNLRLMTSGYIQSSDIDIIPVKDSALFKSKLGISYMGNVYLLKPIFYNDAVYINAGVKYSPADYSSDINPNSQRYFTTGINIGYVHAF